MFLEEAFAEGVIEFFGDFLGPAVGGGGEGGLEIVGQVGAIVDEQGYAIAAEDIVVFPGLFFGGETIGHGAVRFGGAEEWKTGSALSLAIILLGAVKRQTSLLRKLGFNAKTPGSKGARDSEQD